MSRDALDEFIRQLFVCNWVLSQLITGLLERARVGPPDGEGEPITTCAYSMIRGAIGEVVAHRGAEQIEAARVLIEEVMDAISDDRRIFPAPTAATTLLPDHGLRLGPRRRRRR